MRYTLQMHSRENLEGAIRHHAKRLAARRPTSAWFSRHLLMIPGSSLNGEPELVQDILIRIHRKRRLNAAADLLFRVLTLGFMPHISVHPFRTDNDLDALHRRLLALHRRELAGRDVIAETPADHPPIPAADVNDVPRRG